MSEQYTPTTEQVRAHWVDHLDPESGDDFDRWLAQHDDKVRSDYEERRQPAMMAIENIDGQRAKEWIAAEIADAEKRGAVKALREAADKFGEGEWLDAFVTGNATDDVSAVQATTRWLYDRADHIEES